MGTGGGTGSEVAVIDIDGVLADVRHRLRHVERQPKDWDAFFAAAPDDPPLAEGFAVARELAARYAVVYLSGRPERCRAATVAWLDHHDAPSGRLELRPNGDRRAARHLKLQVLERLRTRHGVAIVVDDDPAVCDAARRARFTVLRADWLDADNATAGSATTQRDRATLLDAQERDGRT